jgi:hypothetical protein
MEQLTERQYRALKATHASGLKAAHLSGLTADQLSGLTPNQIRWLTRDQIRWLTPDQIRWLTPDQLRWLTADQIRWLTRDQIRWLTRDQIRWLTRDQISGLTPNQLRGLTADQIRWLTRDQIRWLTPAQLRGLTPDQISGLTRDQIERHKELWDAVPFVENLYSKILEGIRSEQRILDQATFGPDEGVAPVNVCRTPMCIAGHTVNVAGAAGMGLKKRYGFDGAAALIHAKSRPGTPRPRYDTYPDDWALAYIEERAAEEAAKP